MEKTGFRLSMNFKDIQAVVFAGVIAETLFELYA